MKMMIGENCLRTMRVAADVVPHTHDAGDINGGILPVARGGTGASTVVDAIKALGILEPTTSAQIGLPPSATPDDMFNVLAHAGDLHVWRKTVKNAEDVPAGYTLGDVQNVTKYPITDVRSYSSNTVVKAYSRVNVDDAGNVTVDESDYVNFYKDHNCTTMLGKFIQVHSSDPILFIPSDATVTFESEQVGSGFVQNYYTNKYQSVTGYPLIPARTIATYPVSTNRNAYQEGTSAGTTIEYQGCLGNKAQTQLVSYVGTGTYGKDNPCSITVDFPPRVVMFLRWYKVGGNQHGQLYNNYGGDVRVIVTEDLTSTYRSYNGFGQYYTAYAKKSEDGRTIFWYNTESDSSQGSLNGVTYQFLVIG